jgi:DNA-binding MarR family transcriptional regulator
MPAMRRRLRAELQQTRPFASIEVEVGVQVQRTAQVISRWLAEALKPIGLTAPQFNVLRILRGARPDGLPCGRIAERMVTHDPDLTRLLDRLEAAGLVEKSRDTRDRRQITARITEAGLEVVEKASQAVSQKLREALGPVGPRNLVTLANLLERARGNTE